MQQHQYTLNATWVYDEGIYISQEVELDSSPSKHNGKSASDNRKTEFSLLWLRLFSWLFLLSKVKSYPHKSRSWTRWSRSRRRVLWGDDVIRVVMKEVVILLVIIWKNQDRMSNWGWRSQYPRSECLSKEKWHFSRDQVLTLHRTFSVSNRWEDSPLTFGQEENNLSRRWGRCNQRVACPFVARQTSGACRSRPDGKTL